MSLNRIIFEYINNEYAYGQYGNFKVIMMTSNRYINATKLCKQYGKRYEHWSRNDCNKELIDEVDKEISLTHIRASEIINKSFIIKTDEKNELRGTYVHKLLIPHIASWISLNKKNQRFFYLTLCVIFKNL